MALIDPKTPFSTINGNGVLFFVPRKHTIHIVTALVQAASHKPKRQTWEAWHKKWPHMDSWEILWST